MFVRSLTLALLALFPLGVVYAEDPPKPEGEKKEAGEEPPKKTKKETREERRARKKKRQEEARELRRLAKKGLRPKDLKGRALAPDSEEAEALGERLNVESAYAKDGTVMLIYTFRDPTHIGDWKQTGFDLADQVNGRGRRRRRALRKNKPTSLALGASSRGKGWLIHKLDLEDEYEITFVCQVHRMTSRTELVFFVGKWGVRFGNQFVSRGKRSFRRVSKSKPAVDAFNKGQQVTIKLSAKDGVVTSSVNGQSAGSTKKLRNRVDGQVGLCASDIMLFVDRIEIRGKVDKRKLLK